MAGEASITKRLSALQPRTKGLLAGAVTFGLLAALFPHTFWFTWLWAAVVVGVLVSSRSRRKAQSAVAGHALARTWQEVGATVLALIVALVFVPDMWRQERVRGWLRGLDPQDIAQVTIRDLKTSKTWNLDPAQTMALDDCLNETSLFYPSHEGSLARYEMTLDLADGRSVTLPARVPEHHDNDVAVTFRAFVTLQEALIPNSSQLFVEPIAIRE